MPQNLKTLLTQSFAPKITNVTAGSATAVLPAGGQTVTVTGVGFQANAVIYVNNTNVSAIITNSTSLTFTTPAQTAGSYQLSVLNSDGSVALKPGGLVYFDAPVWTTPAGALTGGVPSSAYTTTVVATGGTITYSVTSGNLPTGLALNSTTGVISGTPTTENTFNFTITATNQYNQGTSRTFSISIISTILIDYLVIAGGGGGGRGGGGGGGAGAGGFRTANGLTLTPGTTYTVTVGAGGAGSTVAYSFGGNNGNDSVFGAITSAGGGFGSSAWISATPAYSSAGGAGGSGGGGSQRSAAPGGAASPAGQGNPGGACDPNVAGDSAGGGGGAGAAGSNAPNAGSGGAGGAGASSSITGAPVTYAGGGGGGGGSPGAGGSGGGGAGSSGVATAGTANTGGGGGGGSGGGGAGGSGVVIIRYSDARSPATTTGSPTYTVLGGYRIYQFNGNGSITFN